MERFYLFCDGKELGQKNHFEMKDIKCNCNDNFEEPTQNRIDCICQDEQIRLQSWYAALHQRFRIIAEKAKEIAARCLSNPTKCEAQSVGISFTWKSAGLTTLCAPNLFMIIIGKCDNSQRIVVITSCTTASDNYTNYNNEVKWNVCFTSVSQIVNLIYGS